MFNFLYHILFVLFTIYVLINTISYSLYEIKKRNNKTGGIFVIVFTIFSVVFSNIIIWQN